MVGGAEHGGHGERRTMSEITVPEKPIMIADAANLLGIGERRMRRIVARPEFKDRTEPGTRKTRTGIRPVNLVTPDLYADILAFITLEDAQSDNADGGADIPTKPPKPAPRTRTDTVLPITAYELLLAEKDARIQELQAALESERAAVQRAQEAAAHEREAWTRLSDGHLREQTLRAATLQLPAPEGVQDGAQAQREPTLWERLTGRKAAK